MSKREHLRLIQFTQHFLNALRLQGLTEPCRRLGTASHLIGATDPPQIPYPANTRPQFVTQTQTGGCLTVYSYRWPAHPRKLRRKGAEQTEHQKNRRREKK